MKKFIIYEDVPNCDGSTNRYYHVGNGDVSMKPEDAKVYKAKTWIEFIIMILQFVVKLFSNSKLKYEKKV